MEGTISRVFGERGVEIRVEEKVEKPKTKSCMQRAFAFNVMQRVGNGGRAWYHCGKGQ